MTSRQQPSEPRSVVITKDRKEYFGMYRVERGLVTVTTLHGRKSTQIGSSTAENVATMLLRELIAEGKADDE
jgi:hypothetical protein